MFMQAAFFFATICYISNCQWQKSDGSYFLNVKIFLTLFSHQNKLLENMKACRYHWGNKIKQKFQITHLQISSFIFQFVPLPTYIKI